MIETQHLLFKISFSYFRFILSAVRKAGWRTVDFQYSSEYKSVLYKSPKLHIYISSSDLSQMVLIEPVEVKGRGKFPHIVRGLVSGSNNIPLTTITHGPREVVKILAWDTTNDAM